ncbi:MAG: transporter substrate-binding domain-containing protein [Oscillospiraceae bacterium]|nr:transporter substrate-binding domain-containing protein [Oscillospiraceae bacterium]
MKKFLALMLALMMALSLVACGNDAPPADDGADAPDDAVVENTYNTLTPGVLTVATSPDFAPYEFYVVDENGEYQLAGFDMALAQYIADYLGLKLEVIPMDFDGTLAELAAKTVDLSLAGYSPDPARMDKMDFSDLYYLGGQAFVTVKDKADMFTSLADTNKAELTIGAQNGSIQMDLANENSPEADIVALTKVTDIIAELIAGKLDGAYIETVVAETYAINYPELAIVLDVPYEDAEGSAVGVSKGNTALLEGVNAAIAAALADGSMDKFVAEANEQAVGNIYEGLLEG